MFYFILFFGGFFCSTLIKLLRIRCGCGCVFLTCDLSNIARLARVRFLNFRHLSSPPEKNDCATRFLMLWKVWCRLLRDSISCSPLLLTVVPLFLHCEIALLDLYESVIGKYDPNYFIFLAVI